MQAARRTVTLFRQTHHTARTLRSSSSPPAWQTHQQASHSQASHSQASHSQPRHSFTTPSTSTSPPPSPALPVTSSAPPSPPPTALSVSPTSTSLSIGLASGTLGAMCGIGGAVFAIPALTRFSNLPQRIAAGNSLAAVTAVAVCGAASFHSESAVDTSVALPLALSASLLTPIGARAARSIDPTVLQRAFGAFMIFLAPALPVRAALSRRQDGETAAPPPEEEGSAQRTAILAASGSAIGLTSGILGISGGSLFTPVIALACPHLPFTSVMGTSFAAMVLPTAIAALSYAKMRMVAPALLPALVVGAAVGARFGASLAFALPDAALQYGFAVLFAVMGARTLGAAAGLRKTASALDALRRRFVRSASGSATSQPGARPS